jgi:calpain-7
LNETRQPVVFGPRSSPSASKALLSKATGAEQRQDWDQAFQLYIKAAESFLSLYRSTPHKTLRSEYKICAGKALERAEKIKAVKRDLTPVVVNPFCKGEAPHALDRRFGR